VTTPEDAPCLPALPGFTLGDIQPGFAIGDVSVFTSGGQMISPQAAKLMNLLALRARYNARPQIFIPESTPQRVPSAAGKFGGLAAPFGRWSDWHPGGRGEVVRTLIRPGAFDDTLALVAADKVAVALVVGHGGRQLDSTRGSLRLWADAGGLHWATHADLGPYRGSHPFCSLGWRGGRDDLGGGLIETRGELPYEIALTPAGSYPGLAWRSLT
jgi:hypothetical protein